MEFGSRINASTGMASGINSRGGFATNIAVDNIKSQAFNKYATDMMRTMAVELFKEQAEIAETFLNQRTGELVKHLKSAPFDVFESGGNVQMNLKYILKVRFLDLRKTGTSKPNNTIVLGDSLMRSTLKSPG